MEKKNELRTRIRELFIPPGEENIKEFKETAPFFILITIIMGAMFIQTLNTSIKLDAPLRFASFSIVFFLHVLLYWMALNLTLNERRANIYLAVQGILALTLVMLSEQSFLVIALFSALIGKSIGVLGNRRRSVIAVIYFLILALLGFLLTSDLLEFNEVMITFVPAIIFVIIFIVLFNRQVEARDLARNLLKELEVAHTQLAEYTLQVEDLTLKTERERMARELHDTLAQGLAGLVLQLEAVDSHLEQGTNERAAEIVKQAMTRARETLADSRKAIDDLRMERFGVEDLKEALQKAVTSFEDTHGIQSKLEIDLPEELSQTVIENAERAVIEGLRNVARHAKASKVNVTVKSKNDLIEILIKDDGIGFEVDTAFSQPGHYGLLGLRERARLAGGNLSIQSTLNEGTEIHVQLPQVSDEI